MSLSSWHPDDESREEFQDEEDETYESEDNDDQEEITQTKQWTEFQEANPMVQVHWTKTKNPIGGDSYLLVDKIQYYPSETGKIAVYKVIFIDAEWTGGAAYYTFRMETTGYCYAASEREILEENIVLYSYTEDLAACK